MTPQSLSEPLPPLRNALQRPLRRTLHLQSHSVNLSPPSFMTLRMFSPRCHLTHSRTASHGIMLSSWSSEQRHPPPRCTRCHTMYVLHSRIWRKVIKQPTHIMTCFGNFWANIYYESYEIMTNHEFYDQI